MIRLIASDIDGTLLRDGAVHIAPALFDRSIAVLLRTGPGEPGPQTTLPFSHR